MVFYNKTFLILWFIFSQNIDCSTNSILYTASATCNAAAVINSSIRAVIEVAKNTDAAMYYGKIDENIVDLVNESSVHFFSFLTSYFLANGVGQLSAEKPLIFMCDMVNYISLIRTSFLMGREYQRERNVKKLLIPLLHAGVNLLTLYSTKHVDNYFSL